MTRKSYPTDLTDAQWQAIEPHFNQLRHYKQDKRQLVNAVLYITKTGCQWRMLPNDFPPYSTVWSFYRRANQSGLWDRILLALVQKNVQSIKNKQCQLMPLLIHKVSKQLLAHMIKVLMEVKKIKGRKRHIAVDTLGNLLWFMQPIFMTQKQVFLQQKKRLRPIRV